MTLVWMQCGISFPLAMANLHVTGWVVPSKENLQLRVYAEQQKSQSLPQRVHLNTAKAPCHQFSFSSSKKILCLLYELLNKSGMLVFLLYQEPEVSMYSSLMILVFCHTNALQKM